MEIEKVQTNTINNLQLIIEELKNIQFVEKISHEFCTEEIYDKKFVELFLNVIKEGINHNKYKYIYTFTIFNNPSLKNVYKKYREAKDSKKADRKYARLNQESTCLYVGSSKSLVSRIKQHFGLGAQGTFAMQLLHWCESLNLDINLQIYSFKNSISTQAFQAFEDGAWNTLKPMLGRQGKR